MIESLVQNTRITKYNKTTLLADGGGWMDDTSPYIMQIVDSSWGQCSLNISALVPLMNMNFVLYTILLYPFSIPYNTTHNPPTKPNPTTHHITQLMQRRVGLSEKLQEFVLVLIIVLRVIRGQSLYRLDHIHQQKLLQLLKVKKHKQILNRFTIALNIKIKLENKN